MDHANPAITCSFSIESKLYDKISSAFHLPLPDSEHPILGISSQSFPRIPKKIKNKPRAKAPLHSGDHHVHDSVKDRSNRYFHRAATMPTIAPS
jgi:hypothetical protein